MKIKQQSMEWKHQQSPSRKKFKSPPTAGKLMLTDFWDSYGPVLEHYQEKGTLPFAQYSGMLTADLKPAIHSKCLELLTKGVVLFHDNFCPHTVVHTADILQKLKFDVMAQPLYSPDLTSSDHHLFGPLNKALCGP
jgi:hypothetical protein